MPPCTDVFLAVGRAALRRTRTVPAPTVAPATVLDHMGSDFRVHRVRMNAHNLQAPKEVIEETVFRNRQPPKADLVTDFRYVQDLTGPLYTSPALQVLKQYRCCTVPVKPDLPDDTHSHTQGAPLLVSDCSFR